MKHIYLLLALIFSVNWRAYSNSEDDHFSIELGIGYHYLFYNRSNNDAYFDFSSSFLVSRPLNRLKFSSGVNFSTLSYSYSVASLNPESPVYINEKTKWLGLPVFVTIPRKLDKSFQVAYRGGFLFNFLIGHDKMLTYGDGSTSFADESSTEMRISTQQGLQFTFKLGSRLYLNSIVYFELDLKRIEVLQGEVVPGVVGLLFNIEYIIFNKSKK